MILHLQNLPQSHLCVLSLRRRKIQAAHGQQYVVPRPSDGWKQSSDETSTCRVWWSDMVRYFQDEPWLALHWWHCWTSLRIHLSKAINSDSLTALVQLCYGGTMQSGQCLWSRFSIISRQCLLEGCKHWTQLADSVRPCTMRYVKFDECLAMNWC